MWRLRWIDCACLPALTGHFQRTIDPTPFVAIFFPAFFGLILGDVGYGLMLAALAWLVPGRPWMPSGAACPAARLMNAGIGRTHTVPEHRKWADQLYAIYARGRETRLMVAIVGEAGLPPADRRALAFADEFERTLVGQGARRSLAETIEAAGSRPRPTDEPPRRAFP
jgi:hypothetical protein